MYFCFNDQCTNSNVWKESDFEINLPTPTSMNIQELFDSNPDNFYEQIGDLGIDMNYPDT
jgi:hypothetical protein